MNWQPVIDGLGALVAFWLWPWLIALWAFAAIVQHYSVFDGYLRALGWNGARELLASFGNAPRPAAPGSEVITVTGVAPPQLFGTGGERLSRTTGALAAVPPDPDYVSKT